MYAQRNMVLSRVIVGEVAEWQVDGVSTSLPSLGQILQLRANDIPERLREFKAQGTTRSSSSSPLPAVEADQEVWASGVTYLRSRVEREAESTAADVYGRVYEADRPEIFFKALGWRVAGPHQPIRIRQDSNWDVPEPELTLVLNRFGEIVGYTAGNDVSSRQIEGENPLYLPQAKSYDGSCAIASEIVLTSPEALKDLPIQLEIIREGNSIYQGETNTSQMKRTFEDLASYLFREMSFPRGAFLMTGTGIVPAAPFTLTEGDIVNLQVGEVKLSNPVTRQR